MNDREKKLNEIKQKYINMENEEEEEDKELEDSNEGKKEEEIVCMSMMGPQMA